MNLTGDPWVPVVLANGQSALVSLLDAFRRGHEILDLVATPPQRIALTRLLVCIAQAALDGPADEADWRACHDRIVPAAEKYLDRWKGCFELFGDNAFLQLPNMVATDNSALDKLDFGLAAGNNAVLFDHEAGPEGREHSASWSALMLLTFQCFSPGGTIGASTWSGAVTSRKSEHAPCVEGSMMHTVVRGGSLLETIHMNLLTKELVAAALNGGWGRPVWEEMPEGPYDPHITGVTASYLGRLVAVSRGIRLVKASTKITVINGCRYPKLPHREPAATLKRRATDGKLFYLPVDLSKHPWRELASILASSPSTGEGGPWVLAHLAPGQGQVDLWAGGLATNKGKLLDVAEWNFSLPLALIGAVELAKYRRGVELAEAGGHKLWAAITSYFDDLAVGAFRKNDKQSKMERKRMLAKAGAWYWRALDGSYALLVDASNDPTARLAEAWYSLVRSAMEEAYERACPHASPRQIRAFAKGRQRLRLRKPE